MTKLVVLSDIHANPYALQAVVDRSENSSEEVKYCILGDSINYGPDPLGVIKIIKHLFDTGKLIQNTQGINVLIGGNHEEAWIWLRNNFADLITSLSSCETIDERSQLIFEGIGSVKRKYQAQHPEIMTDHAVHSLLVTAAQLSNEEDADLVDWFAGQITFMLEECKKQTPAAIFEGWNLFFEHSDIYNRIYSREIYPCDVPKVNRYVSRLITDERVPAAKTILLHGHNHIPMFFGIEGEGSDSSVNTNEPLTYDAEITACGGVNILNPGSLGQPRDRDLRPAYAVLRVSESGMHASFHRLQLRDTDRRAFLDQLWREQYPENTIRIAKQAPLPEEVSMNCGEEFFQVRAKDHFVKTED